MGGARPHPARQQFKRHAPYPGAPYRRGDCPVAEAMAKVEFQVGGNYYLDCPDLMTQVAAAMRKVGENGAALREWFDANPVKR